MRSKKCFSQKNLFPIFLMLFVFTLVGCTHDSDATDGDVQSDTSSSIDLEVQDEMVEDGSDDSQMQVEVEIEEEEVEEAQVNDSGIIIDLNDADDTDSDDEVMMEVNPSSVSQEVEPEIAGEAEVASVNYKLNEFQDYDAQLVQAAMDDGRIVVLDTYASWCPTCNANKDPLTDAIMTSQNEIAAFIIDYDDSDTANVRAQLGITTQSTYLRFNGQQEVERMIGLLSDDKIDRLVN